MKRLLLLAVLGSGIAAALVLVWNVGNYDPRGAPTAKSGCRDMAIYIDASKTMRGYFRVAPREETRIQRLIGKALKSWVGRRPYGRDPVVVRVGETLRRSQFRQWTLIGEPHREVFYRNREFDQAFADFDAVVDDVIERGPCPFVLITASVPTRRDGKDIDTGTVRELHQELIGQKHVWLITAIEEFDGIVYPDNIESPLYEYSGPRPILIWLGDVDEDRGEWLKNAIVDEMTTDARSRDLESIKVSRVCAGRASLELADSAGVVHRTPGGLEVELPRGGSESVELPVTINWANEVSFANSTTLNLDREVKGVEVVRAQEEWSLHLDRDLISPGMIQLILTSTVNGPASQWWQDWSTLEYEPDKAGKIPHLGEVLDSLSADENRCEYGTLEIKVRPL